MTFPTQIRNDINIQIQREFLINIVGLEFKFENSTISYHLPSQKCHFHPLAPSGLPRIYSSYFTAV